MEIENFLKSKNLFFSQSDVTILKSAIMQNIPTLLRGLPGVGKTELTRALAEFLHAKYCFMQCFPGCSEEDLVYKVLPSEETKSGIRLVEGVLPEALKSSASGPTVLVLDEWDKTRPSADAFLLDLLQNLRLTVRFDGVKELRGDPKNLWVFLTSNEEREFSEPLLRRCVVLNLHPLPTLKVGEILEREGVKKELVLLLCQLYNDTFNAGLEKPATVQELRQLAKAVEILGDSADWNTLVHCYVVKGDDDWRSFYDYVSHRSPSYSSFSSSAEEEEEGDVDISEFYDSEVTESEAGTVENTTVPKPRMPKVIIKSLPMPNPSDQVDIVTTPQEKSVIIPIDEEMKAYDSIIKQFEPEPSDDPTIFGKFKVLRDTDIAVITSDTPLTFTEMKNKQFLEGQYYLKENLRFPPESLKEIMNCGIVKYYTKDKIRVTGQYLKHDTFLSRIESDRFTIEAVINIETKYKINDAVHYINDILGWTTEAVCNKKFTEVIKNSVFQWRDNFKQQKFTENQVDTKQKRNSLFFNYMDQKFEQTRHEFAKRYQSEPKLLGEKIRVDCCIHIYAGDREKSFWTDYWIKKPEGEP